MITTLPRRALAIAMLLVSLVFSCAVALAAEETYSDDKRFINHDNQTITDTKSGLMWQKEDSYLITGHWKTWHEAFEYIEQLNKTAYGGYIDWRLPTMEELKTLYEGNKVNSKQVGREMVIHIDPIFGRNGSGAHWSVKSNGRHNAFGVVYNTGDRFSAPKISKSRKAVRAVRN